MIDLGYYSALRSLPWSKPSNYPGGNLAEARIEPLFDMKRGLKRGMNPPRCLAAEDHKLFLGYVFLANVQFFCNDVDIVEGLADVVKQWAFSSPSRHVSCFV